MFARKTSELGYRLNNNQTRQFDHPHSCILVIPLACWFSFSPQRRWKSLVETVFAGTAPYPVNSSIIQNPSVSRQFAK